MYFISCPRKHGPYRVIIMCESVWRVCARRFVAPRARLRWSHQNPTKQANHSHHRSHCPQVSSRCAAITAEQRETPPHASNASRGWGCWRSVVALCKCHHLVVRCQCEVASCGVIRVCGARCVPRTAAPLVFALAAQDKGQRQWIRRRPRECRLLTHRSLARSLAHFARRFVCLFRSWETARCDEVTLRPAL